MENLTCIAWGDLRQDKAGRLSHHDCPVVVTSPTSCAVPVTVPLPAICGCGCRVCKDAWFAEGKPISKDGRIIRDDGAESYYKTPKLWWLSFCDTNRPVGSQFLGVCIVLGFDLRDAIVRSHVAKCNPGGSIQSVELPDDMARRVPRKRMDTLLSKQETVRLGEEMGTAIYQPGGLLNPPKIIEN